MLKILVIRPDRMGDVILSTPVFEVIKRHYPKSQLTAMLSKVTAPLIRGLPAVDDTLIYDPAGRHSGFRGFVRLVAALRRGQFRIAVVLQGNWKIALALILAGIRHRVGPLSKPFSFFFYNRGIRQHRSHVEMHETDYSLQLLRRLGIRVGTRNVSTRISLSQAAIEKSAAFLAEKGWIASSGKVLIAVHPGMGGSALNWPEHHYIDLVRTLLGEGKSVLITSGPTEKALIERFREGLGPLQNHAIFYYPMEGEGIDYLAGLYSHASVVVAPSTGPLHLAVALGKPVVTFYPPIRVQSALRWGPYLSNEHRASVLVPEVYCGEDFSCRGNLCNYYPCMKGLTVNQAIVEVNHHVAAEDSPRG